jgi:extracellular sulfatase Sulf
MAGAPWTACPSLSDLSSLLAPTEYKTSYARNRSIRSVAIEVDGEIYHVGLDTVPQPRNLSKPHWPGAPEDQDDKDGGSFSGTGGLPDYSAPNPIKVTHR